MTTDRPDIVCHIGLHKTASGTLQRQFFPACRGLNLLTTLEPRVRQFVSLVTRTDPLYFSADAAGTLMAELLRSDRVNLLSNESLSGPPYSGAVELGLDHRSPVLANLLSVFPRARAVLVLRRQDALARSLYRQYVKRGGTVPVARFFGLDDTGRPGVLSLDRFRFRPFVQMVLDGFQAGVLVLTFEEFVRDNVAFLTRLCVFLGVERPDIALRAENTTRLGPFGIDVTRRMNFLFKGMLNHSLVPRIPVRRHARWVLSSPVELVHDHWPGDRPPAPAGWAAPPPRSWEGFAKTMSYWTGNSAWVSRNSGTTEQPRCTRVISTSLTGTA